MNEKLVEQLINKYEIRGYNSDGEWDSREIDKIKAFAEAYHKAECVDSEAVGEVMCVETTGHTSGGFWYEGPVPSIDTKIFFIPQPSDTEALLCMTQQRDDLLRDLGHARLTDVGLNALEVAEAELAEAMKILNQIADMPRKTREQRLAYSFVTFIKALQSAATL